MASKRQRKKQQTKQNIQVLKQVGVTNKKELQRLRNDNKTVQTLVKKERRKQTANTRSGQIKALGYKLKDHASKRYWSDERYNEWYKQEVNKIERKQKREAKKLQDDNDLYLLIFWRDKTAEGFADTETIERYKYAYKYYSEEQLLTNINRYVRSPKPEGAEIGTTSIMVVRGHQRKQYINFMTNVSSSSSLMSDKNDWILVYEGKVKRYKDLLLAVHAVIRLLYDASERSDFVNKLLDRDLPKINTKMAQRLAKDLNWRRF